MASRAGTPLRGGSAKSTLQYTARRLMAFAIGERQEKRGQRRECYAVWQRGQKVLVRPATRMERSGVPQSRQGWPARP